MTNYQPYKLSQRMLLISNLFFQVPRTLTSQLHMCHPATSVTLCPQAMPLTRIHTLLMVLTDSTHLPTTQARLSQVSMPTHTLPPLTMMSAGMAHTQHHRLLSPLAHHETSWCA